MQHFSHFNLKDTKLSVNIVNVDLSIVNSIRRIILSEIPNVGFYFDHNDVNNKDIEISVNTGVLHNEFIAHRISLLPIWLTENEITEFKREDYVFTLKKKNVTMDTINVTTEHFEIVDKNNKKIPTSKLFPSNNVTKDYILITKLNSNMYDQTKGDELNMKCYASINIAKTHARWCPVSKSCYSNVIDQAKASKILAEKNIGKTPQEAAAFTSKFNTLDIYRYFKTNKYDEPSEFEFFVESECRLRPHYLIFKALSILIGKFENFIRNIDKVKITNVRDIPNFYELEVKNEDYTFLQPLQSLIYNYYFRETATNELEYIGYHQPHPHDNLMLMKIKFNNSINIREFIVNNCNRIIEDLTSLTKEFINFSGLDKLKIIDIDQFS